MIEFREDEEWLELRRDPSYMISTHGRLYSTKARQMMKPYMHPGRREVGYLMYLIRTPTGKSTVAAGREVLTTFRGGPPVPGNIVYYADDDRANCRLDNLSWGPRVTRPSRDYSSPLFLPPSYRERG